MWTYEKKLMFPVKIKTPNPKMARLISSQFGGPHGELGASQRYLSQRYSMPYDQVKGILTDIGTEELAHMEMVCAVIHQLCRGASAQEIEEGDLAPYFIDHTAGIYPVSAAGTPFDAMTFSSTGDVLADLHEDMAAEQKARLSYDTILRFADDPDVKNVMRFLREREIVHFQRFGEALGIAQEKLNSKNFYAFNPAFDQSAAAK